MTKPTEPLTTPTAPQKPDGMLVWVYLATQNCPMKLPDDLPSADNVYSTFR